MATASGKKFDLALLRGWNEIHHRFECFCQNTVRPLDLHDSQDAWQSRDHHVVTADDREREVRQKQSTLRLLQIHSGWWQGVHLKEFCIWSKSGIHTNYITAVNPRNVKKHIIWNYKISFSANEQMIFESMLCFQTHSLILLGSNKHLVYKTSTISWQSQPRCMKTGTVTLCDQVLRVED